MVVCLVWFCECQFELMDLSIGLICFSPFHLLCCVNLWPSLGSGSLFRLGPKSFAHTLEVLASFFFFLMSFFVCLFVCFFGFWCDRMFLVHFVQHLLSPGIIHFSKQPCLLLV